MVCMKFCLKHFAVLWVLLPLIFNNQNAKAESCAKVKIASVAECDKLVVKILLAECNDVGGKATLFCKGNRATATLKRKSGIYSVKLKKSESGWGAQGNWEIDGNVEVTPASVAIHRKSNKNPRHLASQVEAQIETQTETPKEPPSAREIVTTNPLALQAPETSGTPPAGRGITFNAAFDGYYAINLNQIPGSSPPTNSGTTGTINLPTAQMPYRTNDIYSNSLALNLAELSISRKTKETSFRADLDFGNQAEVFGSFAPGTSTDQVSKHIGQAFMTWTPTDRFTFTFGKLTTFIGYEVAKSKDNWNYGRSLLFQLGPFWHMGANATYAVIPSRVNVGVHLYNGWNNLWSFNSGKSIGLQLNWTPNDAITFNANYMTGPINPNDSVNKLNIYNTNLQWIVSPSFTFAWDAVYVNWATAVTSGVNSNWSGFECLAKWTVTPSFYLSSRFEVFSDPQGAATRLLPSGTNLVEGTLTGDFTVAEGFDIRLEGRLDSSSTAAYSSGSTMSKTLPTGLIALLYSF